MEEPLIDIAASPVADVLDVLLQDKTTKKNIIWATDDYAEYGEAFADTAPMDAAALLRRPGIIRPRIRKTQEEQARRTQPQKKPPQSVQPQKARSRGRTCRRHGS